VKNGSLDMTRVEFNLPPGLNSAIRPGPVERTWGFSVGPGDVGPLSLSSHGISVGDPMLVRGRIQSRHRSSTRYFIYILINRERGGAEAVSGYCCSCPNGLRTVGCCSHITTVLWYLGLGQYLPEILIPASYLDDCVESAGQE
jgi:hypothetical protein